jgi:PTS system glucitol/sorbitol-specific IIA component
MIKYEGQITNIGPLTEEFLGAGIIVFFGQEAPEELIEFSIIHDGKELKKDLVPADVIWIDDQKFTVLAVGEVANSNLANLGHLILKFNGLDQVEMPGDVCVENKPIPDITVGTRFRIEGE